MAISTVQTLFGSLDETQLKALKGAIEEINVSMQQIEFKNNEIKDIVDATYDSLKVPKKIIKRMAKVYYNQSIQTEIDEFKDFEALFEAITEVK
jgi:Zn-dependent peptidase ImmA (M78 family)|tara:strand:- start:296 stop:577 length:282 start_codon:yes stop_codon:yes gene_type:complete